MGENQNQRVATLVCCAAAARRWPAAAAPAGTVSQRERTRPPRIFDL